MTDDDAKWRKRLLMLTLLRLGGLAIFLFGLYVFYGDVLRPGGWPQVGAILIILGILDATFSPLLLRRQWKKEDE